jgi:Domain of unknown function (DUF4124)
MTKTNYTERDFHPGRYGECGTTLLQVLTPAARTMKRSHTLSFFCALACTLLAAGVATAQSVPWKYRDAQGRIVVSDRPPPAGVQDKDIIERPTTVFRRTAAQAQVNAAAAAAASAVLAQGNDPELEARRKKAATEEELKKKVQQEKDSAQRAENCSRAKSHLAALGDGLRIARTNEKGEREILDDKGRAEEMQRARQVMASDCK